MARSRKKIQKNITSMLKSHRSRRYLVLGVIPVALILITMVTWSLHVNAISLSDDPICGIEEHIHTADCYTWVAVDDNTETAGTITTAASPSQNEITGTEVTEEVEETPQEDNTKIEDGVTYVYTLICGKEEHTHTDECFASESETTRENAGIMLMSLEENHESETGSEEETASEEGKSSEIILMSTSLTDFSEVATVTWTYDKVTYDNGSFTINFDVKFDELTQSEIVEAEYKFTLALPEGIEVPDTLIDTPVDGYVTDYISSPAFSYTIYDAGDGTYYMEISFSETYVNRLSSDTKLSGYMTFGATCEVSEAKTDSETGDVTIGTGSAKITIDADDIETDDDGNDNWLADLTVTKSASNYDSATNSITYTVVISSKNGTDEEITLTDLLKITDNLGYSNTEMSVNSVEEISVTYYNQYYSWGGYMGTGTVIGADSSESQYYTVTGTETDYNLELTLTKLNGRSADETDSNVIGDCYVVTYTVYFDSESAEYDSTITNNATASTETKVGTVTDYATTTKNATGHMATKSGTYDSSTNTITWTITLNAAEADIAGYTLADEAFAEASNLTITTSDSSAAKSDYTYNYKKDSVSGECVLDADGNGIIESITFNATDTDGDDDSETNTNTYTITYQTTTGAALGSSAHYETNEVKITDSNGETAGETEGSSYVSAGGSMAKSQTSANSNIIYTSDNEATRAIEWTTTIYVPSGGIASGTVLYDTVGCWYADTNLRSTTEADQWFTYDQIVEFFETLAQNGISNSSGDTAISYNSGSNFKLEAYDPVTKEWISYDTLTEAGASTTYDNTLFTAYRITFNEDIAYTGILGMSYSTTVDITDVLKNDAITSQTYYNTAKVGGITAASQYIEYEALYKTDGSGNRDTSDVSLDEDGNLTWIVKLYIAPGSSETYTITDTLPAGLSFVSAKLGIGSDYAILSADKAGSDGKVTAYWASNTTGKDTSTEYGITGQIESENDGTYDYEVMTIRLDSTDYSWLVQSGGYVTITYTVEIDDFDASNLSDGSYTYEEDSSGDRIYDISGSDGYTNRVKVEWGSNSLEDDQTQKVTYTEETGGGSSGGEATHDTVIKEGNYNGSTGIVYYQVALNIDGDTLNDGNVMTFTDMATTYTNDYYGTRITLQNGSVKFYELHKLYKDTEGYYYYLDSNDNKVYLTLNDNGKVSDLSNSAISGDIYSITEKDKTITYYYKTKLDIAWTYSENDTGWGTVYHTISSTEIPDSTSILVEYQYSTTTVSGTDEYLSISNTATLTGNSETEGTDYNQENDKWEEPTASAGLDADGGLTIIKVDENNYGTTIPGTKFALYKYVYDTDSNTGEWVQVTQSDYNSYVNEDEEKIDLTSVSGYTNPMDGNNYLTTDSNGALTISKNYTSENTICGTYSWYEPYTLYYIVEVEPAAGYTIISSNMIYFYWSDSTSGSLTWPDGMYSWNTTVIDLNVTPTQKYVENGEITSFTLVKTDKSDKTTALSGATFALYRYAGLDSSGNDVWKRIGTYITNKNGEISITYDESLYTYNQAYKLTEISSADGYNIGWGDETEFYFWWVSDDANTYPKNIPENWGAGDTSVTAGTNYASAIDISSASKTVTATNTKTTSTIAVTKVWIDENGNSVTDADYSAQVQLYYYLGDANGNPVSTTASSSGEIVTLTSESGTVADTTATLYSYTTETSLKDGWTYITWDVSGLKSAVYSNYKDGDVEIVVEGGDNPEKMTLVLIINEKNVEVGSPSVTSTIEGTTSYYTVKYSIESIKNAISQAGYTESDTWNGVSLNALSLSTRGTMQSLKFIVPTTTTYTTAVPYTFDSSTNKWCQLLDDGSTYLSQDGAVLAISYSGATANTTLQVGVAFTENSENSKIVSLPEATGTVYVGVSDLISASDVDWNDYSYIYIQSTNGWSGFESTGTSDGTTITSVSILLPASPTTTTQYVVKKSEKTENELTGNWLSYFSGDGAAGEYLAASGAMIYIDYTCTEVPDGSESYVNIGIQYTSNAVDQYTITSLITTGKNIKLAVPVDYILSGDYDLSDFNCLYLQQNGGSITINSVSILIPYSTAEAVSGTIVDTDYTVTLYAPSLDEMKISGEWAWNAISSRALEPDIDGSVINSTTGTTFTGYAFLDAIYSNPDSTVEIVLENVSSDGLSTADITSLLKNMQLLIQGDLSASYSQIATVSPTKVTKNDDNTYTLTYSSGAIVNSLASAEAAYSSASEAYADYNALILSLYSPTTLDAAFKSLTVVSEELSTTDTYTESNLLGTIYGGEPYTDSSENAYKYTLNKDNNWTVALYNLPLTCTVNGVTYYYYYYFVETEYSGGSTAYTVTYSQTEGENGGGEIVITNITTTYELPGSGGIGTGIFYICGILILGLGVVLIIILKIQPNRCLCFSRSRRTTIRKR